MVAKGGSVLEVELAAGNRQVLFRPLGSDRRLRGRYDFSKILLDGAAELHRTWGEIPGQRIRIDTEAGTGAVVEPIHDDPVLKEKVERQYRLAPPVEEFKGINVARWVRAVGRLLQSGLAGLVKGEAPEVEPVHDAPTPTEILAAIEYRKLSGEEKAEVDAFILEMRRQR